MSIPRILPTKPIRFALILFIFLFIALTGTRALRTTKAGTSPTLPYPIMFVTQIPIAGDFATIGSTFGNHRGTVDSVARGGDLWIRYPDGTRKNLTQAAGFGNTGFQGSNSIAVRDPFVHWDGNKAIFSMVVGATEQQYAHNPYYWQLYEITGFGKNDPTVVITKVPNQPANYNNISPIYGTDDQIIFTSDRPGNGARHLYPQRDEYESTATNTGLWRLNPTNGELTLLNHAPSGDFTPMINSHGRIVFTQWDHLQRDQQADAHALDGIPPGNVSGSGSFNFSSEAADALRLPTREEIFPEPRGERTDLLAGTNMVGHSFNHFFPWEINQDGTDAEVLLHLGRHELHNYINRSINDDPNVVEYYRQYPRTNPNSITNMFQIEEDPNSPDTYYGVDAPEFETHASGNIIRMAIAGKNADQVIVEDITDPDNADGHYREPVPLSNNILIAVHTTETGDETGSGHNSDYDFRIKTLVSNGSGGLVADTQLMGSPITKSISYWSPDVMISYNGPLWELNPVEVRARTRPTAPTFTLQAPEQQIFDASNTTLAELQTFMIENNLALIVSRDVTTRDDLDRQQPFNLRVAGGSQQTVGAGGKIYDVAYLQLFQGLQVRGYGTSNGRRVLAQNLPNIAVNPSNTGPIGSVAIGSDGSLAAFVPTNRAMTWQLTDGAGKGVVLERYWLTFQPGEVRVCASCHGLSDKDQAGHSVPMNPPEALATLLEWYETYQSLEPEIYLPIVTK